MESLGEEGQDFKVEQDDSQEQEPVVEYIVEEKDLILNMDDRE